MVNLLMSSNMSTVPAHICAPFFRPPFPQRPWERYSREIKFQNLTTNYLSISSCTSTTSSHVVRSSSVKGNLAKHRAVTITVHGVRNEDEIPILKDHLLSLKGVHRASFSQIKLGGLRGGKVAIQLEISEDLKLPLVIDHVRQAATHHDWLTVPYKCNYWMWKGHKINYAVAGCGKPIILVHGFGGNAGHFRNLVSRLADKHRVYSVDLLGFGESDKPSDASYGPQLWAQIIVDFAKEFAEDKAVLVGNSIGSLTVLTAAATADEQLLRGIVLLNVAGGMNRRGLTQDDIRLQLMLPFFVLVEWLLLQKRVASFLFNKFRSKANVKQLLIDQVYREKSAVTDELVDILYEPSSHPGAVDVFVKVFTGHPGERPEKLMPRINKPTLVLWGDMDPWTPIKGKVASYFKQLQEERNNVQVYSLPDVGHCPHDDRPHLAAEHIESWLSLLE